MNARKDGSKVLLQRARDFRALLLRWYDLHARKLPWRESRDPYRVWLSEIMLQQTRVAAVTAHYQEFLRRFPTVEKLAAAREPSVLAAWSGLGYYRRARMLHAAAKAIVRELGGEFPTTAEDWGALPGIGRYTAAAIASIAFDQAAAVVDGNVERVLQRVSGKRPAGEELWQSAQRILDRKRPGDFNQAMMELGATVCTPRAPACLTCPVVTLCATRGETAGSAEPARQKKREICYALDCRLPDCRSKGRRSDDGREEKVFLVQRPRDAQLMPAMWELPEILPPASREEQVPRLSRSDELMAGRQLLFTLRHSITVTDYTVQVWRQRAPRCARGMWVAAERLGRVALTGLARKILRKAALTPASIGH
jgi:A/G-specific adenine glycosylase